MKDLSLTLSLKEELRSVASRIDLLLAEDPFPASVFVPSLQEAVRRYPVRGGKRLRPALLLWACQAMGGTAEEALHAGAACEVFHSWTLVHDDIIDEDDFRRGKPTEHVELAAHAAKVYSRSETLCSKFGHDFAILAGDIQQAWANDLLLRTPCEPSLVLFLAKRMQQILNCELVSGEALDVELPMRRMEEITFEDVFTVIEGKTVCLLKFALQCGGMIGLKKADPEDPRIRALGEYARGLGIAFQLQDDYLGIYGKEEEFGKPLCSDFQEGKPTWVYLDAFHTLQGGKREELLRLTGLKHYGTEEVAEIRTLLEDCGSTGRLKAEISKWTDSALESLAMLEDSPYRDLLEQLARYLLQRSV